MCIINWWWYNYTFLCDLQRYLLSLLPGTKASMASICEMKVFFLYYYLNLFSYGHRENLHTCSLKSCDCCSPCMTEEGAGTTRSNWHKWLKWQHWTNYAVICRLQVYELSLSFLDGFFSVLDHCRSSDEMNWSHLSIACSSAL